MKIPYLVVLMIATAVLAVPSAYSAPGGGAQVTHFRDMKNYVYGSFYDDDSGVQGSITAYTYDDYLTGVLQGFISVSSLNNATDAFSFVSCNGPAYMNAVSANQGNGNTSINATLDPESPDCAAYNVSAPVTVNLTGQFDGNFYSSEKGTKEVAYYAGHKFKSNYRKYSFGEIFTGTNGLVSGTFNGYTEIARYFDREQIK